MANWLTIEPLAVGDKRTLAFDCVYVEGTNRGSNATVSSALVHGYDADRPIDGTVDAGSTTTLSDTDVLNGYSNDALIGMHLAIYDSTGEVYETEITDSAATGQVTFLTCGITAAADDTFRIYGEPLLEQTSGTVSSNRVSYQVSAADMTAYPGKRGLVFAVTYEDGDEEDLIVEFEVESSRHR